MTGPAERARLAELARAARTTIESPVYTDTWAERLFHAAANPTVILALLARLAALEAVASAARRLDGPYISQVGESDILHVRAALRALDGTEGQ